MRKTLFALAAAAIALTSAQAFAGDHGPSQYDRDNASVYFPKAGK